MASRNPRYRTRSTALQKGGFRPRGRAPADPTTENQHLLHTRNNKMERLNANRSKSILNLLKHFSCVAHVWYRYLLVVVLVSVVIVGIGVYAISGNYFNTSSNGLPHLPSPVSIVEANVTVVGQAAGIPCSALRLPCPLPLHPNESTISAILIRYNETYYYVSYIEVNSIRYMIWYNNSTYYCVTPGVKWANTCPTS